MSTNKHGCCADKACTDKTCMELPAGKTCGDCVHERRCCTMFGHKPSDTYCDWFPRRFQEKPTAAGVPASDGETFSRADADGGERARG